MSATVLIISNNRYSLSYASSLYGYGCEIYDTQTIEAARALIRSVIQPNLIIIDMKHNSINLSNFVHFVRDELGLIHTRIVVLGHDERERLEVFSQRADYFLVHPVDVRDLVSLL